MTYAFIITISSLIIFRLTGSLALTGIALILVSTGSLSSSYFAGNFMDRFGRRPVLVVGYGVTAVGSLMIGLAVLSASLAALIGSCVTFGLGWGVIQQSRVAVADMYPLPLRGFGFGTYALGRLTGSILGSVSVGLLGVIAVGQGFDPLALPWIIAPLLLLSSIWSIIRIQPDPMKIADTLPSYYQLSQEINPPNPHPVKPRLKELLTRYPYLVSVVANVCAINAMGTLMLYSPIVLGGVGHGLGLISAVLTVHMVGMFLASLPSGRLADRFGRKWVMVLGASILAASAILTPLATSDPLLYSVAIFLVGFGSITCHVDADIILGDVTHPHERGKASGFGFVALESSTILLTLLAGLLLNSSGFLYVGFLGLLLALLPLGLALTLRERRIGHYDHPQQANPTPLRLGFEGDGAFGLRPLNGKRRPLNC